MEQKPLNNAQQEAVKAPLVPLLIVAGAGTGKTTTLTSRLAKFIEDGIPARRICAITFTNKAAREMAERLKAWGPRDQGAFIGTFHGLGVNILRREWKILGRGKNFVIFDDHDSFDLIKKILKREKLRMGDEAKELAKPGFFANKISEIKNKEGVREELERSKKERDQLALKIYKAYEARLEENNALDFDDLIEKVVHVLKNPEARERQQKRFDAILVDEYQDVNPKQYEMVKLLAGGHRNVSVVGDDEQLIYGWRHADLKIFLGFEKDWPGAQVKFLEENYRSTKNIIGAAAAVAENNNYRRPKTLWTKNPEGEKIKIFEAFDENEEAEKIAWKIKHAAYQPTAVLYRTNAQSRAIEQAFIKNRIPYRIYGGLRFYERKEIKDIIAALRYAVNKDEISRDRLEKNIGKRKLSEFEEKISDVKKKSHVRKSSFVATGQEFRAKDAKRDEGVAQATSRSDERLAAETIASGAEYGTSGYGPDPMRWIELFLKTTAYFDSLEREFINQEERKENIAELIGFAARFDDVSTFLEEVTLMQPTDELAKKGTAKDDPKAVNLMTIHLAKGLEFDKVYIAGCAEGLLPHAMSMDSELGIEEERRLMYVAMTRAKKELYVSFYDTPSRFISEIPEQLIDFENETSPDNNEVYIELD